MSTSPDPRRQSQPDEPDLSEDRAEAADRPEDPIDEAALESFPASDPPAFTPKHVGDPAEHPDDIAKRKPDTPDRA